MQTVSPAYNQAWAEDSLFVDHKVVVEFGSNRFNDGQIVTASSTKTVRNGITGDIRKENLDFWKASDPIQEHPDS